MSIKSIKALLLWVAEKAARRVELDHLAHYAHCNCLGAAAECCASTCLCHTLASLEAPS